MRGRRQARTRVPPQAGPSPVKLLLPGHHWARWGLAPGGRVKSMDTLQLLDLALSPAAAESLSQGKHTAG